MKSLPLTIRDLNEAAESLGAPPNRYGESMSSPAGLGMFIWEWSECDGGSLQTILSKCSRCNISWVAVHFPDVTTERVQAFHDAGIYVAAWLYCVPGDPTYIPQAVKVAALGVDAILPDCEIEWEELDGKPADRRPEALAFAEALRNALGPNVWIGNCGAWQWPDKHPAYPDHAFGKFWDAGLPERYWTMFPPSEATPKEALDESDREWSDPMNVNAYKVLIPIGSAFDGSIQGGQLLRPSDVADFLNRQPTCALWSWQHATPTIWALLEQRAQTEVSPTASTDRPPST